MVREIILKKLEQMRDILVELEKFFSLSFNEFSKNITIIRAAERNFQLLVDLASDINTQIIAEKTGKVPDTYKQSFFDLGKLNVLEENLIKELVIGAKIRNILVHEYDFEEDYQKFYLSAKEIIPSYKRYIEIIYKS